MEAHCIALELKYQNQALKSGQHGQILNETSNKAKIKKEIDVLETMNIELEHSVAKLRKENQTLKKHYKDLYDTIKITRSKTIEQTTSLLANNADLKAQIQEIVLGKPVLQSLRNQSVVRQPNAFKSEKPQMSIQRFASQVDVNNNLSRPVTQHYFLKRRESAFPKPDHMIASSSSRNSSKNMPRFSSNDMVHNYYQEEARKKTQEKDRSSKTRTRFSSNRPLLVYWKSIFDSDLRWKPTGVFQICGLSGFLQNFFNLAQSKVDSELYNGSNVNLNIIECKQSLDVSEGNESMFRRIKVLIECRFTLELESLFGSSFDEYFDGENQVVSKSSAVTNVAASDKRHNNLIYFIYLNSSKLSPG
ncbi:hypothetical protein Tco_0242733 [Tanacetum coccineum]